jgi:glycosyltransferase involved in cell wall biosynthesis
VRWRRVLRDPARHERWFAARALPALAAGRWDVVHAMGRWDAVAAIVAGRVRGHRSELTDLGSPDRAWWQAVGRADAAAVAFVAANVDGYGCMSRYSLGILERDYGRADGELHPGGVRLDEFVPAPERAPVPTLLFSGAITEPRKGVVTLLEALPRIAEVEPEVQLWLSGSEDPSALLAAAPAEAAARTTVLGPGGAKDQHERYGRAWATVLPSMHDSFGMCLVESLACGTPIVVTTHGAPQELVTPGTTGALCAPQDPQQLAAACLEALALARQPGTVEACRASAAPFGWDALAERVEGYYRR